MTAEEELAVELCEYVFVMGVHNRHIREVATDLVLLLSFPEGDASVKISQWEHQRLLRDSEELRGIKDRQDTRKYRRTLSEPYTIGNNPLIGKDGKVVRPTTVTY